MNRCATASREQCRLQHKVKNVLRKEKQKQEGKAKAQSRVPVTASNAWPASIERWTKGRKSGGSTGCNENTQLAPSEQNRSSKSADGRVATVATRREKPCPTKKKKNLLDSDRPSHGRR